MHGFSTVDGFVEITECLGEMIKYVANEPSVGLYYVQQHTQNAVPNLVGLRNGVVNKSRETTLHTEDSEDSITMVRSMKECGFPVADEMIRDIKKSLALMSTKQPKRGLIDNQGSAFQLGRASSWKPASWGRSPSHDWQDSEGSYFSTVLKSAKQKASNLKWPQIDPKELTEVSSYSNPPVSVATASTSSSLPDTEADELPISSHITDEPQEEQVDDSLSSHNLSSLSENFDEFKADREVKLREWLEGTDSPDNPIGASHAERS
ncbi:PREDICTED: uncharacterized protein LOC101311320 isoform 3 [Fragaria vesca subsp. vesca]|uniref:uncharacterized protein LOC101311320 n=1 Tax=Fragaria vesca subsp. vesca TaxID=101020 RepID=UPI0002C3243D|nr:PREDICTED: uncharacterized protein LOC101311320 [Fragaria vesca subsp. vesca]